MDFLGYEVDENPEKIPPGICENYDELNEAVDYIQDLKGFINDRNLFNYGKMQIDEAGGLTIDELYLEASKIKQNERRTEKLIIENRRQKRGENWFRL